MSITFLSLSGAAVLLAAGLLLFKLFKKPRLSQHQVYVGNLHYRTSPQELGGFFAEDGKISRVHLVKDKRTRKAKGFGFVTFETLSGLQSALEKNGSLFKGRPIVIRVAKPQSPDRD